MKERLLKTFESEKKMTIDTDASDYTTTGAVSQEAQSVKFILYKMNTAEQNYTITEKKMLTVVQAIKE